MYSIIIPTYNEAKHIGKAIDRIRRLAPESQIIVVDGGSTDGTPDVAEKAGAELILCRRGRGIQCNAGALHTSADILLFLHADTLLPEDAFTLITSHFEDPDVRIGTFRLSFDEDKSLLRFYCAFTKFDSVFTRFGDQCIVIRRSFFIEISGFPDWPLFEDVHLLRTARRHGKIVSLPAAVVTSARRFMEYGLIRTQLINGWLLLLYFLGVSPAKLAMYYRSQRDT